VGTTCSGRLFKEPFFAALRGDLAKGSRAIIANYPKQAAKLRGGKLLAHIIQSIEAKALRAAQAAYPKDIVLLMHDGWVSSQRLDKDNLRSIIRNATGLTFGLSEEQMKFAAMPTTDLFDRLRFILADQ